MSKLSAAYLINLFIFRRSSSVRHGGERQLPGIVCDELDRLWFHFFFFSFGVPTRERNAIFRAGNIFS